MSCGYCERILDSELRLTIQIQSDSQREVESRTTSNDNCKQWTVRRLGQVVKMCSSQCIEPIMTRGK